MVNPRILLAESHQLNNWTSIATDRKTVETVKTAEERWAIAQEETRHAKPPHQRKRRRVQKDIRIKARVRQPIIKKGRKERNQRRYQWQSILLSNWVMKDFIIHENEL